MTMITLARIDRLLLLLLLLLLDDDDDDDACPSACSFSVISATIITSNTISVIS